MSRHTRCTTGIVSVFCLLLFSAVLLAGCGKAGMPAPRKTQDTFTITGAGVSVMGRCLLARGTVQGAVNHVESVVFELSPIDSNERCPGCPFAPSEYGEFNTSEMQLNRETGQFMFSFCPSVEAPMYRWRLVGKNVFRGLPYATTTPQVMVMPE